MLYCQIDSFWIWWFWRYSFCKIDDFADPVRKFFCKVAMVLADPTVKIYGFEDPTWKTDGFKDPTL